MISLLPDNIPKWHKATNSPVYGPTEYSCDTSSEHYVGYFTQSEYSKVSSLIQTSHPYQWLINEIKIPYSYIIHMRSEFELQYPDDDVRYNIPWFTCYNHFLPRDYRVGRPSPQDCIFSIYLNSNDNTYSIKLPISGDDADDLLEETALNFILDSDNSKYITIQLASIVDRKVNDGRTYLSVYSCTEDSTERDLLVTSANIESGNETMITVWETFGSFFVGTDASDDLVYYHPTEFYLEYANHPDISDIINFMKEENLATGCTDLSIYYDSINLSSYTITVTHSEGGTVDPNGDVTVYEGEDQAFIITPDSGYRISEIVKDGELLEIDTDDPPQSILFENVAESHTLEVTFEELPKCKLTLIQEGRGKVKIGSHSNYDELEGFVTINKDETKTLRFYPDPYYHFKSATLNDVPLSTTLNDSYSSVNISIDKDSLLKVIFEYDPQYQVTFYENQIKAVGLTEINNSSETPYLTPNGNLYTTHFVENEYINIDSKKYLKVFDHDVSADPTDPSLYFSNEGQAKHCFLPNKFSRLGDIGSDLFKNNGKYEFLLRYPRPLKLFANGNYENTEISLKKDTPLHITLSINILSESINDRRMIISNHSDTDTNSLAIELTDNKQVIGDITKSGRLRIYQGGEKGISTDTLSPGIWTFNIDYDSNNIRLKATNGTTQIEVSTNLNLTADSQNPFRIGAADYRNGTSPFSYIEAAITPTNVWKQSANPFDPTFDDSGNIDGYEDVAIQMIGKWGTDGTSSTAKGLGLYTGSQEDCLLDTMPSHDWWYGGLGQYKPYTDQGTTGFPSAEAEIEQHVQLYVRVNNTNYDAYTMIQKANNEYIIYSDNFIENQKKET